MSTSFWAIGIGLKTSCVSVNLNYHDRQSPSLIDWIVQDIILNAFENSIRTPFWAFPICSMIFLTCGKSRTHVLFSESSNSWGNVSSELIYHKIQILPLGNVESNRLWTVIFTNYLHAVICRLAEPRRALYASVYLKTSSLEWSTNSLIDFSDFCSSIPVRNLGKFQN